MLEMPFFVALTLFSHWELTNGKGTFICLEVEGFFSLL